MGTITLQKIAAGADDGYVNTSFNATAGTVYMGERVSAGNSAFFRWDGIAIERRSVINSCTVKLNALASGAGTPTALGLSFSAEDDAAAPTTRDEFYAKTLTTQVSWNPVPAWTSNTDYSTPDLKSILQEIVDREGWAYGNAILLFIEQTFSATNAYRSCKTYEYSTAVCARISVDFTPTHAGKISGIPFSAVAKIAGATRATTKAVSGVSTVD